EGERVIQHVLDGVLTGSILSLGATGLTMVMHMLRFANFSHAELLSIGAYSALVFDQALKALAPVLVAQIGPLSMTGALALAMIIALGLTGASAVLFDRLVFRRIRENGEELSMVFASFGLALIIRNGIGLVFGLDTKLYSQDIVFATVLSRDPLILVKPDQVATLALALAVMLVLHLVLSRTTFGFSLRAVAENPQLAQVNGISLQRMILIVWLLGGGLAALAGVFYGLSNQITPVIGRDLVLPIFAATIVGGIGSIYGALLGGFIVGLASNLALLALPSGYSPSMPFLIILAVLLVRPNGLFGEARA
ncbi:MAG: branched-chain amino acid ABC transporter permease, partial [Pseudomonadota bacterium]